MKRMWVKMLIDTPLDDDNRVLYAGGPPLILSEKLARWLELSQTKRAEILGYADDSEVDETNNALATLTSWEEALPGNVYAATKQRRARDLRSNRQFPYPTVSFMFDEMVGNEVFDQVSQRSASASAGSLVWTPDRGVRFNGNGALQFTAGTFDGIAGEICDLSTLGLDEGILVAMVYQHGAQLSNQHPLFYYGCSGENVYGGWGAVARTNGNVFFYHRAQGSSGEFSMNLNNREPGNKDLWNNTLSAICFEIRVNPTDPAYFEIASADRMLEAGAPINSTGFSNNGYMALKGTNGTAPARRSALGPLTIGGKPNATYSSLSQIAGSSGGLVGLRQLHIQRTPYIPGRFAAVLQDMAADWKTTPLALFSE